ncbi:hypothetical protein PSPO_a1482 [Pseudoalteromonas spongiae UST010723-006]|nr:hypothetical protein PSPO_a1482 [Pseudoalteromonas spongiae UST010723-006]
MQWSVLPFPNSAINHRNLSEHTNVIYKACGKLAKIFS